MSRAYKGAALLLFFFAARLFAVPSIGITQISPSSISMNVPTLVTVTAQITDAALIPGGVNFLRFDNTGTATVVGVLHDDGLNGDATAADQTFTFQLLFTEAFPGPVTLRVSAAFRGVLQRAQSPNLTLTIVNPLPDADGDGYPDAIEIAAGSDPNNAASTPLTVNPIREAVGAAISALNTGDPSQAASPDPSVSVREAVGAPASVLNTGDPSQAASPDPSVSVREAVGAPASVLNTGDPSQAASPDPSVSVREAVSASASVLNTGDPSQAASPDPSVSVREAVGAPASVLNKGDPSQAASPDPSVQVREAVGAPASVLNTGDPSQAASPDPSVSVREAVSASASVLNTGDPSQAASPDPSVSVREAVSSSASVLNTGDPSQAASPDPSVAVREALGLLFSVQNTASASPLETSILGSIPFIEETPDGRRIFRDVTRPQVRLVSPHEGLTLIEGQTITIAAEATDNVGVAQVEVRVNGVPIGVLKKSPYRLAFTIPAGVRSLDFGVAARDFSGNDATAWPVTVAVTAGAVTGAGLLAEFVDLLGRPPAVTKVVSAINMRNPSGIFGRDPYGIGLNGNYTARFTGFLNITENGPHTFFLETDGIARLVLNGSIAGTEPIDLQAGPVPIEITFDPRAGNGELVLSYVTPSGERRIAAEPYIRIKRGETK